MEFKWVKSIKEITPEVIAEGTGGRNTKVVIRKAKSGHEKAKKLASAKTNRYEE